MRTEVVYVAPGLLTGSREVVFHRGPIEIHPTMGAMVKCCLWALGDDEWVPIRRSRAELIGRPCKWHRRTWE